MDKYLGDFTPKPNNWLHNLNMTDESITRTMGIYKAFHESELYSLNLRHKETIKILADSEISNVMPIYEALYKNDLRITTNRQQKDIGMLLEKLSKNKIN